jgi:hypothetical protein
MPIEFPASPSHGNRHTEANSVWEYSSAVPGWSQVRDDYDGFIPSGLTSDNLAEKISYNKVNLDIYAYTLTPDLVTPPASTNTLLSSYSTESGLKHVFANIGVKTEDECAGTYELKIGSTVLATNKVEVDNSAANYQYHHIHMSAVTAASGIISITQACTTGFGITAMENHTRLFFVRWES